MGTTVSIIGIIGTGFVGEALATRLVGAGYTVEVANSRGPETLRAFASRTGAEPVSVEALSPNITILILAIPLFRVPELRQAAKEAHAAEALIIDAGNYYPLRDGFIREIDEGMPESVWVAAQLGVPVVKAFNNIIASRLTSSARARGDQGRIALPVAGDDPEARDRIMCLVDRLGFDGFDAGLLADSWRQQPGQPAYCTDPKRTELSRLLERADRLQAAVNRDKAAKILSKLPPGYPADQLVRVSRLFTGLDRLNPRSWLALLNLGVRIFTYHLKK